MGCSGSNSAKAQFDAAIKQIDSRENVGSDKSTKGSASVGSAQSSDPAATGVKGVTASIAGLFQSPQAGLLAAPGLRLLVFDFDCTIARIHVWSTYQMKPLDEIPITDKTFVDVNAFREFVRATTGAGHQVAVATFGRKDVVNKAITYALGNHDIIISTPADHGAEEGSASLRNKNTQLNSLAKRFGIEPKKIIFLDDDKNNVTEAAKIGVMSIHTPQGITLEILTQVLNQLESIKEE